MGTFIRRVFWIAVLAGLGYVAYTSYVRWWNPSFPEQAKETFSAFTSKTALQVKETVLPRVEEKAGEAADSVVGAVQGEITRYVKQKASDALSAVGAKIFDTAGSLIGTSTDRFPAGTMPVATSSGFLIPPPPATLVANVNAPLVFAITRDASFSVDWGDGKKESGTVPADAMRLVSHAWGTPGDYAVIIALTILRKTETHTFPVRVYQ